VTEDERPEEAGPPSVRLVPWPGPVPADHPDANFLADVATYSLVDPMPTLERLAAALDVPTGALARYVLAKWTTAGSEALLAVGPSALARLRGIPERAEATDTDAARLAAYHELVAQLEWLAHGVDDPAGTYPAGGVDH
jgi:hypothetical protein